MALKSFITSGFLTAANVVPTTTPTQVGLFDSRQVTATITKETEDREVRGSVDGSDRIQILDYVGGQVTYTFAVNIEAIDSDTLALMFGETWATGTLDDHIIKQTVVPESLEITDTDLADATISTVQVSLNENGAWGFKRSLEVVADPTVPAGDQVALDEATTKLIFPSAFEGVPIKYAIGNSASMSTLGVVQTPKLLTDFKYVGHVTSTRNEEIITVVDLTSSGGWELGFGEESAVDLEFRAVVRGGKRSPVRFGRIAA